MSPRPYAVILVEGGDMLLLLLVSFRKFSTVTIWVENVSLGLCHLDPLSKETQDGPY